MEKGHYEVSVAVAENALLPALRDVGDRVVLADGFSCRVQADELAGVTGAAPGRAPRRPTPRASSYLTPSLPYGGPDVRCNDSPSRRTRARSGTLRRRTPTTQNTV